MRYGRRLRNRLWNNLRNRLLNRLLVFRWRVSHSRRVPVRDTPVIRVAFIRPMIHRVGERTRESIHYHLTKVTTGWCRLRTHLGDTEGRLLVRKGEVGPVGSLPGVRGRESGGSRWQNTSHYRFPVSLIGVEDPLRVFRRRPFCRRVCLGSFGNSRHVRDPIRMHEGGVLGR